MILTEAIRAMVGGAPGRVAVYARNLATNEIVDVEAHLVMPTESAAKTFLLVTYSRLVAERRLDPADTVEVPEGFQLHGTGVLRHLHAGLTLTLEDLAWLMVVVSDNVATALLLLEVGGPEVVNTTLSSLGLEKARLASFDEMATGAGFGWSTPRDLAEVYVQLDHRSREMLSRQQDLVGLPRALPHHANAEDFGSPIAVRVFNKTGTGIGNFVDAGLFETDGASWVVAVMATDQDGFTSGADDAGPVITGRIGRAIFEAWNADAAAK